MGKYVVTGKKPFYGPDGKFYQPGETVELEDLHDVEDADGNMKSVGMSPGRFLKPKSAKAAAKAPAKGPHASRKPAPSTPRPTPATAPALPAASPSLTGRTL